MIQWYSKGIYKFKYAILEAVRKVFDYKSIYEKVRFKDSEYSGGFVEGDAPEFQLLSKKTSHFIM